MRSDKEHGFILSFHSLFFEFYSYVHFFLSELIYLSLYRPEYLNTGGGSNQVGMREN